MSLSAAAGGIGKWVDDQGRVYYGDKPPAGATVRAAAMESGSLSVYEPASGGARRYLRESEIPVLQAYESARRERIAAQRTRARAFQQDQRRKDRFCAASGEWLADKRRAVGSDVRARRHELLRQRRGAGC